eukprot:3941420-Rhodomonas_salina.2
MLLSPPLSLSLKYTHTHTLPHSLAHLATPAGCRRHVPRHPSTSRDRTTHHHSAARGGRRRCKSFQVLGFGSRFLGSGLRVEGLGFRV